MKSRFRSAVAFVLMIISAVLFLAAVFLKWPLFWRLVTGFAVIAGCVLQALAHQCPYCDKVSLRGFFWQKECTCKNCNKKVPFK